MHRAGCQLPHFWERLRRTASGPRRPSDPRVFVYEHKHLISFLNRSSEAELDEWAHGSLIGEEGARYTQHDSAPNAVLLRLMRRPQMLAEYPQTADLYVIPLVPYPNRLWPADDPRFNSREVSPFETICPYLLSTNLTTTYPHLSRSSARRHLLLSVDFTIHNCADDGISPTNSRLLKRMHFFQNDWGTTPYNGALHTQRALAMAQDPRRRQRRHLMSFGGGLHKGASADGTHIREAIQRYCIRVGDSTCKLLTTSSEGASPRSFSSIEMLLAAFEAKRSSHFCLEPPGAAPLRKGIVDALQQ